MAEDQWGGQIDTPQTSSSQKKRKWSEDGGKEGLLTEELDPGIEDFIKHNYVSLTKRLDVKPVIPYLIQDDMLTITEKQRILSKETKEDKAEELIDTLSGSGKCTTKQFINVLRMTNQTGLIECLSEANLQNAVGRLKNKYGDPVLPVRLQLGLGQTGDISKEHKDQILERILELERTLFTPEVLGDPERYRQMQEIFLPHAAVLMKLLSGSVILLLTFLRQTDVDRFYHNHYRVGEGSLSQQLSHILISEHLQDKVKGAQLIVRLQVKHEDYVRVRDRLGRGLDRTTSVDNLLTLPPPNRQVDHSSLRALDLAVVGREDQSCAEGRDHNSTPKFRVRQMQAVVRTGREKAEGLARQLEELQIKQGLTQTAREETEATEYLLSKEVIRRTEQKEKAGKILEQKLEIQHLKETNNSMAATIVELTAENTRISNRLADIPKLCEEVRKWREKDKTSQKVLSEHEVEIQRLQETNKSMAATIEELLEGKHTLADGFSAAATSQDSRKSLLQRFMGLFSSREDRFETPADPAVGSIDDESGPLRLDRRITTGSIDDESGPRRLYGRTTIGSIEESPRYDVFISYSSKESPWVRDLQNDLKQNGYILCLCECDFGDVANAIHQSRKVILVISENFIKSGLCSFVLNLVRKRKRDLKQNCVVIKYDDCEIPRELAELTCLDWAKQTGKGTFWAKLHEALGPALALVEEID